MGFFGRDRIKDGVAGTARVLSIGPTPKAAKQQGKRDIECIMQLEIALVGRAAYAVEHIDEVPHAKMPIIGGHLPIVVSAGDPQRVRIEWDDAPDLAARAMQAGTQAARGNVEGAAAALGFTLRDPADPDQPR